MAIRTLELPDRAHRDALASALNVALSLGVPKESLYIGAGTALTMRWNHRAPTGVWVFMPLGPNDLRHHTCDRILSAIQKEGGKRAISDHKWAKWTFGEIEVGIYASSPLTEPRSDQVESSTEVPVESSMSAFRKKLVGRFEATGDLVPRDAVDMVEFARREPAELRRLLRTYVHLQRPCINEFLFQAEIEPLERLRPLWTCVSGLFQGRTQEPLFQNALPEALLAPQPGRRRLSPDHWNIPLLPDAAFSASPFREKAAFDPNLLIYSSPSMAGHPLSPSPEEIRNWLHAERRENLPDNAESFMAEFLKQLFGAKLFAFRQSCGASPRDIAKMTRWTGFMMSPRIKAGLNRLPKLRFARDRTEEIDAYAMLTGFQTPA